MAEESNVWKIYMHSLPQKKEKRKKKKKRKNKSLKSFVSVPQGFWFGNLLPVCSRNLMLV